MANLPIIKDLKVADYLAELAADSLFPSAGAAAALGGAQAASLFAMVCRVNLRKSKSGETNSGEDYWSQMLAKAEDLCNQCLELAQADGLAYRKVVDGDPQGPDHAIEVPLEIASNLSKLVLMIKEALPLAYKPVQADAETALHLAEGSKNAALAVARHNLKMITDTAKRACYRKEIENLMGSAADKTHLIDDSI
jgi:formiminotetrahydrofolate cyclodeaminase